MVLFKVNSGCRQQNVCGLRWDGDRRVGIEHVVFLPAERLKNGEKRLAMTSVARSIVDSQRCSHPDITIHLPRTVSAEDKEFGMA
jgi:hypothetical protein